VLLFDLMTRIWQPGLPGPEKIVTGEWRTDHGSLLTIFSYLCRLKKNPAADVA